MLAFILDGRCFTTDNNNDHLKSVASDNKYNISNIKEIKNNITNKQKIKKYRKKYKNKVSRTSVSKRP